jgi:hypothetical protein
VLLIDRSLNVATPDTAARVRVPDSVPDDGLVPIEIVTLALDSVARLPSSSRISTLTPPDALIVWLALVLVGWVLTNSSEAAQVRMTLPPTPSVPSRPSSLPEPPSP